MAPIADFSSISSPLHTLINFQCSVPFGCDHFLACVAEWNVTCEFCLCLLRQSEKNILRVTSSVSPGVSIIASSSNQLTQTTYINVYIKKKSVFDWIDESLCCPTWINWKQMLIVRIVETTSRPCLNIHIETMKSHNCENWIEKFIVNMLRCCWLLLLHTCGRYTFSCAFGFDRWIGFNDGKHR